nr:hypothetical protein [Tanacetum cinerariifolium]
KSKTFNWGEEQERAFQTLKDNLCNAPILALLDGPKDFMVYCDAFGLGLVCVLMKRGKVIAYESRQLKIYVKNYTTYDLELVADALSRKARVKPKRVQAMNMTLQSKIKDMILAAQEEPSDESAGLQKGLDEMIECRSDRALYYMDRIWVPLKGDVRTLFIDKAYKSKYSVHPGADKMYYDLRDRYWWPGMKKNIAMYERIAMDFVTKLPRTSSRHDTIWVIMDRLTKSSYFLPMRKDCKIDRLARLYLNEIVARHGVLILIISNRDSRFTLRFWQTMQEALGTKSDMNLLEELNGVHDTFHVSNLKKCLADPTLKVPLDKIQIDAKLNFVEEPVKILEREFKKLKQNIIIVVNVQWNLKHRLEFT